MGFQNEIHTGGATFFSLSFGKCRIRAKEKTEATTERQTKEGKIIHELVFDSFTGVLVDITTKESDFGKQREFTFVDSGKTYVTNMNYSSPNATRLLNAFLDPAIDLSQPIKLKPYDFKDEKTGKQRIGVTVLQNDEKIYGKFCTNSYPVEGKPMMPDLEKIKYKGEDTYDSTAQLEFLDEQLQTDLMPRLKAIKMSKMFDAHDGSVPEGDEDLFR